MLRLLRNFKPKDWFLFVILIVFIVFQVYCDVSLPAYTSNIVSEMKSPSATTRSIMDLGITMIMYCAGSLTAIIVQSFLASYLASGLAMRIRYQIFTKVNSFSHDEMSQFSTPSLITRSTNDVQQVANATTLLMRIALSAPLIAIWAILKIKASSFELTVATAIGIVIMLVGILSMLMTVIPRFKVIQKLTDRMNGVTRENLTGLRVVKAYNAENFQKERFEKANNDLTSNHLFTNRVMALMNPLIMSINFGLTITIYWLGAYLINKNNDPQFFATLFSFSQLAMQVVMAFMILMMFLIMFPRAQVSANRINEVLKAEPKIRDPKEPKEFISSGNVEFKNVTFSYPNANVNILSDISFQVNKGETLAIIGMTGSGKTTLINLILRFFDVTRGEILVNGVNIRDVALTKLYRLFGYVPQKSVLFTGSVKDNIAYGNPKLEQDKIELAAKIACADEFIDKMDGTYDYKISQGGKNVSGGQKQRLSIARAVAIDPEIYLFDDSFSALDYKTDAAVRSNLKKYAGEATKIIIAQRIGTIIDADKIIVLDQGCMVGYGTHKQLLKDCEIYKNIALSQLSGEELGL